MTKPIQVFDGDGVRPPAPMPTTVAEAVARLMAEVSKADREHIAATKREDLIRFHHGMGTWIRNNFKMWSENRALVRDCEACMTPIEKERYPPPGEPLHPDDASMVIIDRFWTALHGVDSDSPVAKPPL